MENEKKLSETKLLYDPLFDKKPDIELHDDPSKGLLGKTLFKKALFIIVLAMFIGISIVWSFSSLAVDTYKYEENGNGYLLSQYRGGKKDRVLCVDYVYSKDGIADKSKTVNEVREFAVCCNEYLEYIYIGETVEKIDTTSFYSCTNLKAVIVSEDNPYFKAVDGILYRTENGIPTEVFLCPSENGWYRAAISLGVDAAGKSVDEELLYLDEKESLKEKYNEVGKHCTIADTVTKIDRLAFAYCKELEYIDIPDGVTEIETLAFIGCLAFRELKLPDGLLKIGSDAFNGCSSIPYIFIPDSVTEIDHHAFYNCSAAGSVHMGHKDDSNLVLGEQWSPRTEKSNVKSVEVFYNQIREGA